MSFSKDVVLRAAEIISSQGPTPMSPGAIGSDGTLKLCAAAALAAAGLEIHGGGPAARTDLEREIIRNPGDKSVLENAFLRLGWTRAACSERLMFNDDCNPFERQNRVLDMLNTLAAAA